MLHVANRKTSLRPCGPCGAKPGHHHDLGCSVERCPYCGGQLLMCLMVGGCSKPTLPAPWPPPLDDRLVWAGEYPGLRECREFGWYYRLDTDKRLISCGPGERGALEDLNRLLHEAEWDRSCKRFVRTSFTEALGAVDHQGILFSRGWALNCQQGAEELTKRALSWIEHGQSVQGFCYSTFRGEWRKLHGKDFALRFGQVQHPRLGPVGLAAVKLGEAVCACLEQQKVGHQWDGDPERPIRIFTSSIECFS